MEFKGYLIWMPRYTSQILARLPFHQTPISKSSLHQTSCMISCLLSDHIAARKGQGQKLTRRHICSGSRNTRRRTVLWKISCIIRALASLILAVVKQIWSKYLSLEFRLWLMILLPTSHRNLTLDLGKIPTAGLKSSSRKYIWYCAALWHHK